MTWKNDAENANRWDLKVHVVKPDQLPFEPQSTSTETVPSAVLWVR